MKDLSELKCSFVQLKQNSKYQLVDIFFVLGYVVEYISYQTFFSMLWQGSSIVDKSNCKCLLFETCDQYKTDKIFDAAQLRSYLTLTWATNILHQLKCTILALQ